MANCYNEIIADEEMCFSKLNFMFLRDMRRSQYDKKRLTIHFDLRPLVSSVRILNSEIM